MSDDPSQYQQQSGTEEVGQNGGGGGESNHDGEENGERQTKRFKSSSEGNEMNQEQKPLSQQPSPTEGAITSSVFQRLDAFEREHSNAGIPPSRYSPEHRKEYMRLMAEKEAYEKMIAAHFEAIKDEPEFKGQDPKKWIDAINTSGLDGATEVVGFAAASANMHNKMIGQIADYKRKWEEAEKKIASSGSNNNNNNVRSNESPVKGFNQKPAQSNTTNQPPPQNNNNNNNNAPQGKRNAVDFCGNEKGWGDVSHNPNQSSVKAGNDLLKIFGTVHYRLQGHQTGSTQC